MKHLIGGLVLDSWVSLRLFPLYFSTYIIMVCKPLSIAKEVLALLADACHGVLTFVYYFGIPEMGC